MGNRRMTRLTNAFSKKAENHAHMMAIYFMHYNFVRIHQTLKVTPAMASGVTPKLWEMSDLVKVLEDWEKWPEICLAIKLYHCRFFQALRRVNCHQVRRGFRLPQTHGNLAMKASPWEPIKTRRNIALHDRHACSIPFLTAALQTCSSGARSVGEVCCVTHETRQIHC